MILPQRVLVTGGASGLGRATAAHLAKLGAKVVVADLPTSDGEKVVAEMGPDVFFSPADVTKEEDVENTLEECRSKIGGLNLLVNCAGISNNLLTFNSNKNIPFALEYFERILKTNVVGTFNVLRLAAPLMAANEVTETGERGVVINTSGFAAFDGHIGHAAVAASQAAVTGMTLPVARDLSSLGIRVNCISPGIISTPLTEYPPENVKDFLRSIVPFPKRFGDPMEFALAVVSIVSNPYLNGATIRLDGAFRSYES